jgi:hypothetical protein
MSNNGRTIVGEGGVDIHAVRRLLGHSEIKTTRIYAKVYLATLERAAKEVEEAETDEDCKIFAMRERGKCKRP